jgi:hypothetical protein
MTVEEYAHKRLHPDITQSKWEARILDDDLDNKILKIIELAICGVAGG